jgi:O-antigen/teichoic acid export membrane protein
MLQWCLGSGLVLAIGLNILGPWGLQLIFGPEYAILSAPVLKKMAWMLVPQFALLVFVRQAIDSGKTTALAIQGLVQLLVLTLLLANATQASKGLTAETASMAALFSAVLSMVVLILYSIVSKKSR